MKVFKAQIIIAADAHEIHTIDVIEHAGQFWLVPEWLNSLDRKWKKPARIVSLATMSYQRMRGSIEFVVNDPIPRSVLFGQPSPEEAGKFVIHQLPDILIPIRRDVH